MKKKSKNLLVLIVLLAIIGIAVGYAALSQQLTLNGTAKTKSSKDWDVHFGEISHVASPKGVEDPESELNADKLTGTFSATLMPEGSVTYTVTVVNDGTISAVANGNPKITLSDDKYFTCTVTDAPATAIVNGSEHTYNVTLAYKGDELPEEEVTANATVDFDYVQQ